jgi:multicomponent K+:H+ antiporter subunit A
VPLATAALFDLGVYVTVVGATMLTLSVLGAATKPGAGAKERPQTALPPPPEGDGQSNQVTPAHGGAA